MFHLSSERLAAIADDEPTAAEAMHLAGCARCNRARRLHQELLASSRKLGMGDESPITNWNALQERLSSEGLISTGNQGKRTSRPLLRRAAFVAAGLTLLAGGVAAGRVSAGASPVAFIGTNQGALREVVTDDGPATFTSTAEALNVYLRSQQDFQRSAAYLAANDTTAQATPQAVLTRLAALEEIYSASVAGLRGAPTDPVLNDYYVSALNAREATRRQLEQFVPVGAVRRSY